MFIPTLSLSLALAAAPSLLAPFIRDNDHDGDGRLSWSEVEPLGWSRGTFELKDMDHDGFITEEDLARHAEWIRSPVISPAILAAMDVDGDGKLRKAVDTWWWDDVAFDAYDKDHDGVLDPAELKKLPKARNPKKVKAPKPGARTEIGKALEKALATP
jgi:hypothetical protein